MAHLSVFTHPIFFFAHIIKERKQSLKKCKAAGGGGQWWVPRLASLFRMQIVSEFLISINAWATLNAFNFQSRQAEE